MNKPDVVDEPVRVTGSEPDRGASQQTDQVILVICETCKRQVSFRATDGIQYHTAGEPEDGHQVRPIKAPR